jgi:hypothetical protein
MSEALSERWGSLTMRLAVTMMALAVGAFAPAAEASVPRRDDGLVHADLHTDKQQAYY